MRAIKFLFCFALTFLMQQALYAQWQDSNAVKSTGDTVVHRNDTQPATKAATPARAVRDSQAVVEAPAAETATDSTDSIQTQDSSVAVSTEVWYKRDMTWGPDDWRYNPAGKSITERVTSKYRWFSHQPATVLSITETNSGRNGKEILFYILCGLLLYLGLVKFIYPQFFNNIFRVYLNTSLRQSQLTEQLIQARWPSFLMNIFFLLVAGIFVWLLFHFNKDSWGYSPYLILGLSVLSIAGIYFVKFCFLKFIGWISGISVITDQYIFIIFLVNKLLSVILLPFVVLLAFGRPEWNEIVITFSLLCAGVILLSRYIKSYGLLGSKVMVHPFHFFLFFVGAELIPPMLLYKAVTLYFT